MSQCMCGARDCRSCGPAQGAFRCGTCGQFDCDEHDEQACEGCGEVVTETAESGLSLCCGEPVASRPMDEEPFEEDEPDLPKDDERGRAY